MACSKRSATRMQCEIGNDGGGGGKRKKACVKKVSIAVCSKRRKYLSKSPLCKELQKLHICMYVCVRNVDKVHCAKLLLQVHVRIGKRWCGNKMLSLLLHTYAPQASECSRKKYFSLPHQRLNIMALLWVFHWGIACCMYAYAQRVKKKTVAGTQSGVEKYVKNCWIIVKLECVAKTGGNKSVHLCAQWQVQAVRCVWRMLFRKYAGMP